MKEPLGEHEDYVDEISKRLVQLASTNELFGGHKDGGVVGACVLMACRGCKSNINANQIAESIRVGHSTVNKQLTVVKKLLVQLSNRFLPYISDLTMQQLDKIHLQDVLSKLKFLQTSCSATLPTSSPVPISGSGGVSQTQTLSLPAPAYQRAQAERAKREAKIQMAIERIQLQSGQMLENAGVLNVDEKLAARESSCLDEEYLSIHKALTLGAHPNELIGGHYEAVIAKYAPPVVSHDIHSEELCEDDLPDDEMDQYIRELPVKRKALQEDSDGTDDHADSGSAGVSKRSRS